MSVKTPACQAGTITSASAAPPEQIDGFEFYTKKVEYAFHIWSPDSIAVELPPPSRTKTINKTTHTKKSNHPRILNSGFSTKLGQVAIKRALDDSAETTAICYSKEIRASTVSTESTPPLYVSLKIASMGETFPKKSLVPQHMPIPISVQSALYGRLTSAQMVWLNNEEEIPVIVPRLTPETPAHRWFDWTTKKKS